MSELSKDEKRFWEKVVKGRNKKDCWLWEGAVFNTGYGKIRRENKIKLAHRISWELHFGHIPEGMCVCHKCDVPLCVNPGHLFLGTQKDNIQDKVNKGRQAKGDRSGARLHPERVARGDRSGARLHPEKMARKGDKNGSRLHPESRPRGEKNCRAKISDAQAAEIKSYLFQGCRVQNIADFMGVSKHLISRIKTGKTWKHIPFEGM